MVDNDDVSNIAEPSQPRILVAGRHAAIGSAAAELAIPSLLLRSTEADWSELVHVYVPLGPTVAFSSRDLRRPGILAAAEVARSAGFEPVVRSPGGQMVAYDAGAVVIDHITRSSGLLQATGATFADNAASHADVLRGLGGIDARVGAVDGEYCPGEFSINVGGQTKVVGSAQRITSTGSLFSTVVQVEVSPEVRAVITAVSAALGYELRETSIAGLADYETGLASSHVAAAFAADYRDRLGLADGTLPEGITAQTAGIAALPPSDGPFAVDAWVRSLTNLQ